MNDYGREFSVGKMCKVFKVSKSSYYQWMRFLPSKRHNENRMLLSRIRRIHEKSKATYGSPRITKELQEQGFKVSRPRVARLMKTANIKAVHKRKYVVTTDSKHNYPVVENKLQRDFSSHRKSQVWVSDITYIPTQAGWIYLTVIIDLFDRKVVGWSMSNSLHAEETTLKAFSMAIKNRPVMKNLIFHSDRGVQYACKAFTKLLKAYQNIQPSMSGKGDCWDNAVAESFFKSLKVELVYRNKYQNKYQAKLSIFQWIETWYNTERRHSALGNLSINEFEQLNNKLKCAA